MEYDSVLDQQSISGKNVSLILCVWKPGYMKSGRNLILREASCEITRSNNNTDCLFGCLLLFHVFHELVIKCGPVFKHQLVSYTL